MIYDDIDEDIRIKFEILLLKTFLIHKSIRDELMNEIEVAEDVFNDILLTEPQFPKIFDVNALEVYLGLLNKMVLIAKDDEHLRTIIETGRDKCQIQLRKKRDYRLFNDILDSEDIDEDDEKVLTKVSYCSPSYVRDNIEVIQLIVLEIDRAIRNANTYKGSYMLDVGIIEMVKAYEEQINNRIKLCNYEIRDIVLQCLDAMYNCKEGTKIVKIYSFATEEHLFDILL